VNSSQHITIGNAYEIRLTIPDTVAAVLQQQWPEDDIPRHILEDLVLKWYQEDMLTAEEVRLALGLPPRSRSMRCSSTVVARQNIPRTTSQPTLPPMTNVDCNAGGD
jgi:hypothetical protein